MKEDFSGNVRLASQIVWKFCGGSDVEFGAYFVRGVRQHMSFSYLFDPAVGGWHGMCSWEDENFKFQCLDRRVFQY